MLIALYMDADSCGTRFVAALRRFAMEVVLGTLELPDGASDDAQLERAVALNRVFITGNAVDFAKIHSQWAENGREHAGVIVWAQHPRRSPEAVAEAIFEALRDKTMEALRNSVQRV